MLDSPLRLGIAGLGFGQSVHLPVFASLPDVRVVAVASSRPEKAQDVAAKHGIPHACSSLEDFFAVEMDAVALALPPDPNARYAEAALKLGLPALIEKPVAGTLAQARRLSALAALTTTAVDFTFAELPAFRLLRDVLLEKRYGCPRNVQVTWLTESYAHANGLWSWKLDEERHGGVMTHQGSHVFHTLEWLLGPVQFVHAAFTRLATAVVAPTGTRPAEDGATLFLHTRDRVPVAMMLSNAAPGSDGLHRWEIVCDGATLTLSRRGAGVMDRFELRMRDRAGREEILYPAIVDEVAGGRVAPFRSLAERFVAAVREGGLCHPSLDEGVRVQELLEEARCMAGAEGVGAM